MFSKTIASPAGSAGIFWKRHEEPAQESIYLPFPALYALTIIKKGQVK